MLHGLNDNNSAGREFIRGLCSALPIALGYLPVAVAFAVISRTQGIPDFFIVAMSLLVFAGASQFAAAGMWGGGGSVGAIVLATFVLNLRHLLFSASLSRRLEKDVSRGCRRPGLSAVEHYTGGFGGDPGCFAVGITGSRTACRINPYKTSNSGIWTVYLD